MERKRDYSIIYHRKSSPRPSGPLAPAVLGLTILADEINLVGGMIDFDPSITTESVGFSVPGLTSDWNLVIAGAIPEPATLSLLAVGGLLCTRRRRMSRRD